MRRKVLRNMAKKEVGSNRIGYAWQRFQEKRYGFIEYWSQKRSQADREANDIKLKFPKRKRG